MSEPLYNTRILRLAAEIPHFGRLDEPMGTARKVSPVCGSRVDADVDLDDEGRISRFAQEVRACALGQASSSLLGARVVGMSAAELRSAETALRRFLAEGDALPANWSELEIFAPARPHKARHASLLLAFEAAAAAAESAAANRAA
ncbi:iron-sulfur cluster assembly scaffold protein [Pacificimonas flava]|uniref:Iron-sulfur cluster assembly scaffold protein n=2 Tax=Pacificimonas TaxID=1960290 RepID=A0A219B311_9SPHN|nr:MULTISPECIES: iron-sulfur cluster assembly scaffold protein [Pacificimonas]MBZ6378159.1 iron-sulfur cluster assembly scaffold protein [Pacificimonas aurantium]OWV32209.1 iron-sulfur cluster assembly scaffold protein [Pacificimonas flava]